MANERRVEFRTYIDKVPGGWEISVCPINVHGQAHDFAKINAHDLGTALEMALPYMRCVARPDPFEDMLPARTATDAKGSPDA